MAARLAVAVDVLLLFAAVLLEAARAAVRSDRYVVLQSPPPPHWRHCCWTQGDISEPRPLGAQSRRGACVRTDGTTGCSRPTRPPAARWTWRS